MRNCLSKCKQKPNMLSHFDLLYYNLRRNIHKTFESMVCCNHDQMEISAICVDFHCDAIQRVVCIKCIVTDHHHSDNLLFLKDFDQYRSALDSLIRLLQSDTIPHQNQLEIEWLRDAIFNGNNAQYPQLTIDYILNEMHDRFQQKLEDLRSDMEQSVGSINLIPNKNKLQKMIDFRQSVDQIMNQVHSQINVTYQQTFLGDSLEQRSTDIKSLQQYEQQHYSHSVLQELQEQQDPQGFFEQDIPIIPKRYSLPFESESPVKLDMNDVPLLPEFNFIDKSTKKWLRNSAKVNYQLGGKIIACTNALLISSESFNQDNIEIRIKTLNFIQNCVHFGVVEESTEQLNCNPNNTGFWGCLHQDCQMKAKLNKKESIFCIPIEGIVGLNLNFKSDIITIKLWTRDSVVVLYQKVGCLLGQKQRVFLSNVDFFKFELIN